MQGTRERVLDYIVHRREARVEELAEALAITPAAVRRHLDNLRADGLVDVRAVKQATGRPYYAYHPTELAAGQVPAAYADLLARMLRSLGEQESVAGGVTESVAASLASRHLQEMAEAAAAPQERIEQVTESLRQEGILETWRSEADGYHLTNGSCPYRLAAQISKLPCESDRKAIELLLGLDVEQVNRIVDGAPGCEYVVRAEHERQLIELSEGVS
ncbi:MAG: ArsR family transcriptional regulator [Gemmataceae bacterium]|nr:ArsR family transcriptional regulator [Gemmataceae bacterium]